MSQFEAEMLEYNQKMEKNIESIAKNVQFFAWVVIVQLILAMILLVLQFSD